MDYTGMFWLFICALPMGALAGGADRPGGRSGMKRKLQITLVVLVMALILLACDITDPFGWSVTTGAVATHSAPYRMTATFGAAQLHIQLTEAAP